MTERLTLVIHDGPGDMPLVDKYTELKNALMEEMMELIFYFNDEMEAEGLGPSDVYTRMKHDIYEFDKAESQAWKEFYRFASRFDKCLTAPGCGHTEEDHVALLYVWERRIW